MATLPFDADNHYYEPLDAFTRHQPGHQASAASDLAGGQARATSSADKLNRFIPNPTFDPIIVPGASIRSFAARCRKASIRAR